MLRVALLSVLVSSTALAAPSKSNPGLDKVCDAIAEEATVTDTLAAAFAAAVRPPVCDLTAEAGICLGNGKVVLFEGGAAAVTSIEPTRASWGVDDVPIYVMSIFPGASGGSGTVSIQLDGKVLAEGVPTAEPVYIQGALRKGEKWTHVAFVRTEGKVYGAIELGVTPTFNSGDLIFAELSHREPYTFDDAHALDSSFTTRDLDKPGQTLTVNAFFDITYYDY